MCCARALSMAQCTSTCSTARRRWAMPRPNSCTPRTVSRSRASSPTAWTKRGERWTCACSSTACPSAPSSSRTVSPSRRSRTPSSSTSGTATRASGCSSSAVALCTLRWTTARCGCALSCAARARGSCPSTRVTTTVQATRPTRTASRPTTCGKRFLRRRG